MLPNMLNIPDFITLNMEEFPLLGQAYELKEQFFDIYEAESINEAYKLYQNWLSNVPKELMTYFEDLIKAMNSWEEEIFNLQLQRLYRILEGSFNPLSTLFSDYPLFFRHDDSLILTSIERLMNFSYFYFLLYIIANHYICVVQ